MTESSLFNPGFLGGGFNWWVGQIADDSTWRDNILPGKFENENTIPGWGRRYKVAIIGLHDQEEETISTEDLPWVQVMYPVTAGGGQTNSLQTANLRQGMFVFGFFLDGQDQQIPVIMGVLGNNAQTKLKSRVGRFVPTSGFAQGKNPLTGTAKPEVPDEAKVIYKPKTEERERDCIIANPGPNLTLNKYGIPSNVQPTKEQQEDIQSASIDGIQRGLSGEQLDNYIKSVVQSKAIIRCRNANSPVTPPTSGAQKENADAVHQLSAADVKREEKYQEKIPLMKPDNKVISAIRCIQVTLDNLTQKINKYVKAISSYVDAVTNVVRSISELISNAACEIAKYMKIIFDKIMEYVLKLLNKELAKVVSSLPASFRNLFADVKEIIIELISCLYNKLTNGLCGVIDALLNTFLKPDKINKESISTPNVPMCRAESLVGETIAFHKKEINDTNDQILRNINDFIKDAKSQVNDLKSSFGIPDASLPPIPDISSLLGSINAALNFENLPLILFGCELKPNIAVSDFYTFANGGASQPDPETPFVEGVATNISLKEEPKIPAEKPYALPSGATPDVNLKEDRD